MRSPYHQLYKIGLCLIWVLFCNRVMAQELSAQTIGRVKEIDIPIILIPSDTDNPVIWSHQEFRSGADFLMLYFEGFDNVQSRDFEIIVSDFNSEQFRVSGSDIELNAIWTAVINGPRAIVEVVATNFDTPINLILKKIAFQSNDSQINSLSIIEPNELEHIRNYESDENITKLSQSIAKLSFVQDRKLKVCTGFLIKDNLLMTNQHCISNQLECESATAIFGFQKQKDGPTNRGKKYQCDQYIKSNKNLDYSILKLKGLPGETWGVIPLSNNSGSDDQKIYIVQHPGGKAKQISILDCAITKSEVNGLSDKTDFSHRCDTKGGSSGSPVFDMTHKIIGLHHYGVDEDGFWTNNRAVQINQILDDL